MALDLWIVALILVLQPVIAILWAVLLGWLAMKIMAWRAGVWADQRIDRASDRIEEAIEHA